MHYDIYVDGCFVDNNFGGAFIVFDGNKVVFKDSGKGTRGGDIISMRNVAGELSATMRAVAWLVNNQSTGTIHYDYLGIEYWVTGEWQAKKLGTKRYVQFMKPYYDKGIITFNKIKAHTGIFGNELADRDSYICIKKNKSWRSVKEYVL